MNFPSQDEFIELNKQSEDKLIEIFVLKGDEEIQDDNFESWEIVSVGSNLIEIDLFFVKPLYVSSGDQYDKLLVQVALSQYEDENQANLPASVNKSKEIPL